MFNVVISAAATVTFLFASAVPSGIGDRPQFSDGQLGRVFLLWLFGANVMYSLAYAVEFVLSSDDVTTRWNRFGRTATLIAGILASLLIAAYSGSLVAEAMWTPSGAEG